MRAFAEHMMGSRLRTLLVVVIGAGTTWFSWLSAALLGLVSLRRGKVAGCFLLFWALFPALLQLLLGSNMVPLSLIVGTTALALLLRWSVSWPLTLIVASMMGVFVGFCLMLMAANYLDQLAVALAEAFDSVERQMALEPHERSVTLQVPHSTAIAGLLGLMNVTGWLLCLLLARWWQSSLYNPGGFRQEFHGLRYSPAVGTALLTVVVVIVAYAAEEYRLWAAFFAMPLSVAGLGLVHANAAHRNLGGVWLGVFYVLWLLLDPVKLIVMGLAVADSWVDFRRRWKPRPH